MVSNLGSWSHATGSCTAWTFYPPWTARVACSALPFDCAVESSCWTHSCSFRTPGATCDSSGICSIASCLGTHPLFLSLHWYLYVFHSVKVFRCSWSVGCSPFGLPKWCSHFWCWRELVWNQFLYFVGTSWLASLPWFTLMLLSSSLWKISTWHVMSESVSIGFVSSIADCTSLSSSLRLSHPLRSWQFNLLE